MDYKAHQHLHVLVELVLLDVNAACCYYNTAAQGSKAAANKQEHVFPIREAARVGSFCANGPVVPAR